MSPNSYPGRRDLAAHFKRLFVQGVSVREEDRRSLGCAPRSVRAFALYGAGSGPPQAALMMDEVLCGSAGAALSMLSPQVGRACTKTEDLGELICSNLQEIFTLASTWFSSEEGPGMRLRGVQYSPGFLSSELELLLARSRYRLDVQLEIAGYPAGSLCCLGA